MVSHTIRRYCFSRKYLFFKNSFYLFSLNCFQWEFSRVKLAVQHIQFESKTYLCEFFVVVIFNKTYINENHNNIENKKFTMQ